MSWDLQWSVEAWLEALGLPAYTDGFLDNGYDLQELCANLKGEDLDAIGVKKEHHRKRIFAESSALREEAMARFKKSNGGGSAGSTDQSGSMGSHGSFPAYTEPWGDEAPKHLYSDVWIGEQAVVDAGGGHGITPALAQLMQNGGQGQALADVGDKQKGLTFPPAPAPPPKAPRKKTARPPVSSGSQSSSTLPAAPALPPPLPPQPAGPGGLNKVQLKLKVLEELQKDRIILSEPPYSKNGSVDEEKVSELCQVYSERFHIEPAQIMETVRDICGAAGTKRSHDETDTGSHPSSSLAVQRPVMSTSDIYEEPVDVMSNGLTTFNGSSPPKRSKAHTQPTKTTTTSTSSAAVEDVTTEPVDCVSKSSPPLKKKGKKKGSPVFLQKPKPSSSESSPEQKCRTSPRSSPCHSPCHSPQPSPATSPREHKKLGLFGKWKGKKSARSQSVKDLDSLKQSKAGKAVLLPATSKPGYTEDTVTSSPSLPLASKKRSARTSLSLHSPPLSPGGGTEPSPTFQYRTTSVSSTSTTASETSPLAPRVGEIRKKFEKFFGSPSTTRHPKTRHLWHRK